MPRNARYIDAGVTFPPRVVRKALKTRGAKRIAPSALVVGGAAVPPAIIRLLFKAALASKSNKIHTRHLRQALRDDPMLHAIWPGCVIVEAPPRRKKKGSKGEEANGGE
jgi:hypothetical protein